jgi:hypothetical protein
MKKVRKNAHKKINAILESVTEVKVYSLDNNFSGEIIGLNKEYFLNQISNFGASLMDNENGTFTLDIHSNLWYAFSTEVIETVEVEQQEVIEIIEELQQTEVLENNSTIENNEVIVAATYKLNDDKNGVEIYFTDKPSEEVRNLLKANKFRWSKYSKCWYAKQSESTISLAKQLAGEETQETTQEPVKVEYDEVFIDDCTDEKYIISQSLIDREHDANWIFRQNKKDYNKELQEMFISYTENVKEVTSKLDNEYYIYKIKCALQSFKKKYHAAFVSWLSAKASQPHWAVSGRGNLNKSRYDKTVSRQDKWLNELVSLPNEFESKLNYYTNKDKKDKENLLKEQIKLELSQPLPELNFKTVTKELDIYGNGNKVKTRIYECEGYFTCKAWGAWRVYEINTGKEIHSTKSNGTLKDAKAYISLMIKRQLAS